MKLYAPKYYLDFTCIADRCRHSCCVGWEIDIDERTLACYDALDHEIGQTIRTSIDRDGTPHFRLTAGERCPHLNGDGLCRIILAVGEGYLCDICREHPRFYHETTRGMEVGLGMACEEACRIILCSDDYADFVALEGLEGEVAPDAFDVHAHRERIYACLRDRTVPYAERLARIGAAYGVCLDACTDAAWRERLAALEYLDEAHRTLFSCYSSCGETPREWETVLERALAYFVYRHASAAEDADDVCAAVGFSLLCERLFAAMIRATDAKELAQVVELGRILSEEIEYSEENTEAIREYFQ